jgi:hypothetical protein
MLFDLPINILNVERRIRLVHHHCGFLFSLDFSFCCPRSSCGWSPGDTTPRPVRVSDTTDQKSRPLCEPEPSSNAHPSVFTTTTTTAKIRHFYNYHRHRQLIMKPVFLLLSIMAIFTTSNALQMPVLLPGALKFFTIGGGGGVAKNDEDMANIANANILLL